MLFKYLLLSAIIYVIYRSFNRYPMRRREEERREDRNMNYQPPPSKQQPKVEESNHDYIDYEELD